MRNFKTKSIFLNILLAMLCVCAVFIFSSPIDIDRVSSGASCIKYEEQEDDNQRTPHFMDTGEDYGGKIPFSLYLSRMEGTTRYITDYQPSFTATAPSGSEGTYYYIMDEDARPSFLLSSGESDMNSKLYNTSVYFIFNDSNFKELNDSVIPNESGYLSVTATVNGEPIIAEIDTSTNSTTKEASYIFSVNLQKFVDQYGNDNTANVKCPQVRNLNDSNTSYLGGEGADNDVSRRTGLYSFHIEYSFREATSYVSNRCVFEMSFYILDFTDYVKDDNPFNFINTDKVTDNTGADLNYEVYNYNYEDTPIVEFDATKFGINFVYTAGFTNYSMVYDNKSFTYNFTPTRLDEILTSTNNNLREIKERIINGEQSTGNITIYLKNNTDIKYTIRTYYQNNNDVYGIRYYVAKFDLKDFENFLTRNISTFNGSTTMQGTYHFDLDFLGQTDIGYSVIDKSLFDNIPSKISGQKLVIFGYELKYFDQDPLSDTYKKDVSLINESTHTNFVAFNSTTASTDAIMGKNTGFLVNIPKYIAITDQAPLRFHSYGNLVGENYTASYRHYTLTGTNEEDILKLFETEDENAKSGAYSTYLDYNKIQSYPSSYTQGASISGDGIRIMRLIYSVSLPLTNEDGTYREPYTVTGTQYVVFEINNTVQNLYIQAYDREKNNSYDFDTYTNKDIRINLEQKPNTFFAPVTVNYSYSSTFKREEISGSGIINLKRNRDDSVYEYKINGKDYGYFVTNQNNSYTFTTSGYYKVTIRSVVTNSPKVYSFIIDKESFSGVSLNQVKFEDGIYKKSATTLPSTLLSGNNKFLKYDLYITGRDDFDAVTGFTLGWDEKKSGASSHSFVYYMEITDDTENMEPSLFDFGDVTGDFWLTNGLKTKNLSSAIDNYKNSGKVETVGDATLNYDQYFNKDGLYFFYVYDDAGNFFTRIVLIDSSASSTLQGYWDGTGANREWINTFNPVQNPQNYVNHDTTIYFGTHKAISLPDLTEDEIISIEDTSFTRAYDLSTTGGGNLILNKPKIEIDFNNDILLSLKNYVKTTTNDAVIGTKKAGTYLTILNQNLTFVRTPTTVDLETEQVIGEETSGSITKVYNPITNTMVDGMYMAQIYTLHDPSTYGFINEAEYMFRVSNLNGSVTGKYICMNFDIVRGTFYGYDNGEGDNTYRVIRKNGATNLNKLKFEYNMITDETADYYTLKTLVYDYYEFVVDESSSNSSKSTYPFASTPTASQIDMLLGQRLDKERSIWMIDPINIDTSELTRAGRYVITRTYVGGTHNLENGVFVEVGTGGKYYKNEEGQYIDLFELDTITRKYIVYVDHYGIITSTYMVRDDAKERIREVGDNISITLSNKYDDEWGFKEFFLTSTATLSLDTNKVPIKINIPISKYFVYYRTINDNLYSKLNFAKLDIIVSFRSTSLSEWLRYKIDGFDETTGLCTCSKLITNDNPNGYLIFRAAGQYKIEISDRTGYIDITSTSANSNNIEPTTYTYTFEISHNSPYANAHVTTYNTEKKQFETNMLYNDDNSNNFATNIKKVNGNDLADNKVTVTWNDPVTPYSAKVNQINITVTRKDADGNIIKRDISIDLKEFDLLKIAQGNGLVDIRNISNNNYVLYLKVSFFENVSDPVIYDNTEYYRFSYEMNIDITEEYTYKITFSYVSKSSGNQSYVDDKGNSFAESLYTVTIDRTKPYTNINSLLSLSSEEFLNNYYTSDTINNFKEENFNPFELEKAPSSFTYTFGVNNSFVLNYNSEDTVSYFFVRNYEKYDDEYISITPDMVDTVYPTNKAYYTRFSSDETNYGFGIEYPRFAEVGMNDNKINIGNYEWYKISYDSRSSLYSLIANATNMQNPTGFYEIIERDFAGNYRSFTVYFSEFATDKNFLTLHINGYHDQGYAQVDNESSDTITATHMFEITELSSKLGWGKVSIRNNTLDVDFEEEILFNPYDSFSKIQTRLDKLNEFFKCEIGSVYIITLSKYNNAFGSISRGISIVTNEDAKLSAPTVEEVYDVTNNKTTYNMVFPAYTTKSVLFLENLIIEKRINKEWVILKKYEGKNNIPEKLTNLEKGIYKATYEDNYKKNGKYSYIVYVGEYYINDFNKEYTFEYGNYVYDNANDVYYSGGDITITYESNVYLVEVDGEKYSGTSKETDSTIVTNHNCKSFTLKSKYSYDDIPANESVGGSTTYTVTYRDITDSNIIQKTFTFTIFNELPKVTLLNSFGGEITSTLEESLSQVTNSVVTINWDEIKNCDFAFLNDSEDNVVSTARLYSRNQNGEYKDFISINKGQTISDEGYYKLQILNNKLGNYRDIYFVILHGDFPLYTVTVNKKEIKPSSIENLDLTSAKAIPLGAVASEEIIKVIYSYLNNAMNDGGLGSDYASLKNQLGFKNDLFDINTVGICSLDEIPHYYSIVDTEIVYNSNMELNIIEFVFRNDRFETCYVKDTEDNPTPTNVGTDYWTTIYLVYNLKGPIRIEFFAVTKVPLTNTLLRSDLEYLNEDTNRQSTISLETYRSNYQLYYPQIKSGAVTLSWNKLSTTTTNWYNQGNAVRIFDKYGVSNDYDEIDFKVSSSNNNYITSTIVGSGSHQIKFQDIAGNTQFFRASGSFNNLEYYTLDLIDSVIYYINYNEKDYNPIQYGVFNDGLTVIIDSAYLPYYLNSRANVNVTRNGSYYNGYEVENNVYTFKESGRYSIELSGSYARTAGSLRTTTFDFTIIDSKSARLAYEFVEVPGYEITSVVRNGEDITDNFRDSNGKILSLFLSSTSNLSGNGNYSITLKYGKNVNDTLTYTFSINNYIPTLSCNVEYGGSTTGSIIISFNPSIIYEQLGECYIRVLTYNNDSKTFYRYTNFTINENSFTDSSSKSIEITRSNSYFVQVETKNGNVISSFRVDRTEPLNTFAIIIIVIAVVAVIVLIIVIVKLRTKMKVK